MTFSGDLRGISLADIFQNIAGNRVAGTLRVQWRNTERFVRFEEGKIAGFSPGPSKGLSILDYLTKRGYVDPQVLHQLVRHFEVLGPIHSTALASSFTQAR